MTRIVLARFDSMASARSAAHALIADGITEQAVSLLLEDGCHPAPSHRGMDLRLPSVRYAAMASCEDSIGCMHGSSEPDLRNWKSPT
ncbi:hypothetical protein J3Q30_16300, partial [Bordetella holmesii]|nr:hypothetical protein [Bordetella holmesii]MBO1243998.1 hypothetical protein [Bordetella holmesii]MBO1247138.1 hypothetical protein [Bordetella holmesii]MBO1253981.1 hypothetical protein [Bordetella holmesii]MBO1260234.1 hypothetical protein [Bordetella holmesii]